MSLFVVVCVSKRSGAEQAQTVLKMKTVPLHSSGPTLHTWQGCIDEQLRTNSLVGFATETSDVELGQISWISERDALCSRVLSEEPLMLTSRWRGGQGRGLLRKWKDVNLFFNPKATLVDLAIFTGIFFYMQLVINTTQEIKTYPKYG